MTKKQIRNVAIIAHVDHGKTTLVDGLLKQSATFRVNEAIMGQDLIMDSNDQERERGITILAKNTAINYHGVKINIIDTPGHADFGGEVERTLNMASGAILLIDAQEGPMPQTKFVLKKAFDMGLKIIVLINKIDKPNADIARTLERTYDLFLKLAQTAEQLEFPIFYASARIGKAWDHLPENVNEDANLSPIFDAIINYIDAPQPNDNSPFQMLVSALDYDNFMGKYAIGKINAGKAISGQAVTLIKRDGKKVQGKIEKIYITQGLKKIEVNEAYSGDIIAIAGFAAVSIGDTLADSQNPVALPSTEIEEPTLAMSVYANTSPLAGKEGKFVTARHLLDRITKELDTNISMKFDILPSGDYVIFGRGELHLSVFVETLRREGYELQLGKPRVITKEVDGIICEPVEELTVDVEKQYASAIIGEVNKRRGQLIDQQDNGDGSMRLVFEISTRGILGFRSTALTLSRGTAVVNSLFIRFDKVSASIPKLRNGVLVASESGRAVTYGLSNAQQRGSTFILPTTEVYEGMIVGIGTREDDIDINVTKEKKLTNVRSNAEISVSLAPPIVLSLEQCIDFLENDELLEVTPKNLRLRKQILSSNERMKAKKSKKLEINR